MIINNNEKMQQKFINFTGQKNKADSGISPEEFSGFIETTKGKYLKSFESIDIENPDWDSYQPPHTGYIEQWEEYQFASEQEFGQIFGNFKLDAIDLIIQQKIDILLALNIGIYMACREAKIIDTIGSFEDINEHLISEHESVLEEIIDKVCLSAISGKSINSSYQLFFRYLETGQQMNSDLPNYFEQFLISIAGKSNQPGKLLSILDNSKVDRATLPELTLVLIENSGDTSGWHENALKYYRDNNEIAGKLLTFYFKSDKNRFIETAKELFESDKRHWALFLQDYMETKPDITLYVKVFFQLTVYEKKTEHYQKIKEYMTSDDIDNLLKELKWDNVFIVKILEIERRYEEIKQIVKQNHDDWHYNELIQPILTIYPDFCFNNIKTKILKTIENQRGRSIYERIAGWVKLALTVPGFESQARELVLKLYNHKPNLPALRDEFRKSGLV